MAASRGTNVRVVSSVQSNPDGTHAEETMFTTLVESRAVRRRTTRGAAISIALHSLFIAAAVALTHPRFVDAYPHRDPYGPVVYVPAPMRETQRPTAPTSATPPTAPNISQIHIPAPTITPLSLPPTDYAGPALPPDHILIGGGTPGPSVPGPGEPTNDFRPGGVVDERVVDRVPRIIGNAPAPRYPDMLRQSGATGQVVVRFVVDTLGRAEMGDVAVVEATHPLFASAVKSALAFYRFSPGEAAGRKVRTMVQVPFTFTLK